MADDTVVEPKCTCPCIDCIEGNHCGGEFWWPPDVDEETGQEPQMVGKCEYLPSEWFEIDEDPSDYDDDFDDWEDD